MKWTNKKPKTIGWYWQKAIHKGNSEILYLKMYKGKLHETIENGPEGKCFWEPIWADYLWSGPITEPKNYKKEYLGWKLH